MVGSASPQAVRAALHLCDFLTVITRCLTRTGSFVPHINQFLVVSGFLFIGFLNLLELCVRILLTSLPEVGECVN